MLLRLSSLQMLAKPIARRRRRLIKQRRVRLPVPTGKNYKLLRVTSTFKCSFGDVQWQMVILRRYQQKWHGRNETGIRSWFVSRDILDAPQGYLIAPRWGVSGCGLSIPIICIASRWIVRRDDRHHSRRTARCPVDPIAMKSDVELSDRFGAEPSMQISRTAD